MKNIRIEIKPDILLQMKVHKVAEQTGVSVDTAINEALVSFLANEGSNNPDKTTTRSKTTSSRH